jgi:hypothetical protein
LAKEMRSRIRLAPSSIEYSEWQCKCAKGVAVNPLLPYVSLCHTAGGTRRSPADARSPRPSRTEATIREVDARCLCYLY